MFSKGCLHCFRVDIWKERGVKPELDRKELFFVHPAHLVQVHVCASWADNAHPMMEGQNMWDLRGTAGVLLTAEKAATVKSAVPTNKPFELYDIPRTVLQYLKSRNITSPEQTFV